MKKTILTTIFLTLAAGLAAGVLIAQDAQTGKGSGSHFVQFQALT